MARLRAEQKARHCRFGDTIFLLEPDLKNGPGGMRDLCVGRWAATARFGTRASRALQAQGEMTARLARRSGGDRLAAEGAHRGARGGRAPPGPAALRPPGGDRAVLYPEARDRGGVIRPGGSPGGRGADAPVPAPRQADPQRDRAPAAARDGARDPRRKTQPVDGAGERPLRRRPRRGPELRGARRDAGADRPDGVRAQAVGDDPHLPGRDRPRHRAGAAHARAHRRAGRVATTSVARRSGGGPALRRDRLRQRAIRPTRRGWSRCRTWGCWPR